MIRANFILSEIQYMRKIYNSSRMLFILLFMFPSRYIFDNKLGRTGVVCIKHFYLI